MLPLDHSYDNDDVVFVQCYEGKSLSLMLIFTLDKVVTFNL